MAEMLLNWVADALTFSDIIDLYFIVSDLVDIPISETERCETAYFDALALNTVESATVARLGSTPTGKRVY